jgi:hypothetical protein
MIAATTKNSEKRAMDFINVTMGINFKTLKHHK